MSGDWLTVSEAARFLGVSDPTLRKWTDCGLIDAWRTPGGHRRYLVESLIRFREGLVQKITPAGEPDITAREN